MKRARVRGLVSWKFKKKRYEIAILDSGMCEDICQIGFPSSSAVRIHLPMQEMQRKWVQSLGQEDPLEKEMATHSSIFAWRIPWTEEPGGLQSMGSQRVRHD